jgi:phage tail sheath protein FI
MNEQKWLSNDLDNSSVASSFVQLCYPWLRTAGSENLPEQLEPPEGALAGILARNAMTRGSFRSATNLKQQNIIGLSPKLRQDQMYAADPKAPDNASAKTGLIDRVSLFALTPDGIQLVSDVTTSNSVVYRQAAINRIISMVVRAARRAGEDVVFDSSGEQLWADLRDRMTDLLQTMLNVGALRGATPDEAFQVRCDSSTMTQRDLDAGRVIAHILIQPAASIETIEILLSMGDGGQVSHDDRE